MRIAVVREIKNEEHRVALTPDGARSLAAAGHQVLVEHNAGRDSGFIDQEYAAAGASIVSAAVAWDSELILKVKEPLAAEYPCLKDQILFTYLHLAGVARELTEALLAAKTTAIAYETVEDETGHLPLLTPMSAVAGTMAVTMGSWFLARYNHGNGTLLGRLLGQRHGKVVVVGDGIVGCHAARMADGMGARVAICGIFPEREAVLKKEISPEIEFFLSTPENLAAQLQDADLVVGAVLMHGARAPHVISEDMVKHMPKGSVIVDVSIDQGGCVETSCPTSHSAPVFEKYGVLHYCVTNMPGAYPRTSTIALTEATLPYVLRLANQGLAALKADPGFGKGLNTHQGHITCQVVAEALGRLADYREFSE